MNPTQYYYFFFFFGYLFFVSFASTKKCLFQKAKYIKKLQKIKSKIALFVAHTHPLCLRDWQRNKESTGSWFMIRKKLMKKRFLIHWFEPVNQKSCFLVHWFESVNRKDCFLILWFGTTSQKFWFLVHFSKQNQCNRITYFEPWPISDSGPKTKIQRTINGIFPSRKSFNTLRP